MKIISKSLLIFSSILPIASNALGDSADLTTYLGVDGVIVSTNWKPEYGASILNKNSYGLNFIGGHKLSDAYGFEIGYEYLLSTKKHNTFNQGQITLGKSVPSLQEAHVAKHNMHGWFMGAALFSDYYWDDLQFSGSFGLSKLKPKIKHTHESSLLVAGMPLAQINAASILQSKSKFIPRISMAANYYITDETIVKFGLTWHNTVRFKNISNGALTARMNNTISGSIGVYMLF